MSTQSKEAKGLFDATVRAQELAAEGICADSVEVRLMDEGYSHEDAAIAATQTMTVYEVAQRAEDDYATTMAVRGVDVRARGPQGYWLLARTIIEVTALLAILYFSRNSPDNGSLIVACVAVVVWRTGACAWEFYQDKHPFGG